MKSANRRPQVCVLGSAEPGSRACPLAADAGAALAALGITVVSGCGSPATPVAAERAIHAKGLVLSIVPPDEIPPADGPATVVAPCGVGDARYLLMALAGDACIFIGGARRHEVRSAPGLASPAPVAAAGGLWRLVRRVAVQSAG
jgi:predicted Rossmann-fold nucleotide-binding protein